MSKHVKFFNQDKTIFVCLFLLGILVIHAQKSSNLIELKPQIHKDQNGYRYVTFENDPTHTRIYTLKNGLTVYLAQNFDEPRIYSIVAVKAGSAYDPSNNTGLAHYLEHLMSNGTDSIGTLSWQKERPLLEKISDLYEERKNSTNQDDKVKLTKRIDSLSYEASKYAIGGELERMSKSIGTVLINAVTNMESTAYMGLIPSGSLEKYLLLQKERFSKFVPRLFQAELEIVYEEFNKEQDDVWKKKFYAMMNKLFPNHPYGQQKGIGTSQHLKNPSIYAVNNFYESYYAPNNMALIMTGDLDFDNTIKAIDDTMGTLPSMKIKENQFNKESKIDKPLVCEVQDPNQESMFIGYRLNGANYYDELYTTIIDKMLINGTAGLMDLNPQAQSIKSYIESYREYGIHYFDVYPKSNQSLETVKNWVLEQLNRIKKGDFPDWLMLAAINEIKTNELADLATIYGPSVQAYYAYIKNENWGKRMALIQNLKKINKQDLVNYAYKMYVNNYVVVYKREGKDSISEKVEKPTITPTIDNTKFKSEYAKSFYEIPLNNNSDVQWIDFKEEIQHKKLKNGTDVYCVDNKKNDLFKMDIVYDFGTNSNKELDLAISYLKNINAKSFSINEFNKVFYQLGLKYDITSNNNSTTFHLEGLEENLYKGMLLWQRIVDEIVAIDDNEFEVFKNDYIQKRKTFKTNKQNILWRGLLNYALYEKDSPYRNQITNNEILTCTPNEICKVIKDLKNYKASIFFYGNNANEVIKFLNNSSVILKEHKSDNNGKTAMKPTKPIIYFVDYDAVQASVMVVSSGNQFNQKNIATNNLFNSYYNNVLNADLRESKSLTYGVYTENVEPSRVNSSYYYYMYFSTQNNKLLDAIKAAINNRTHFLKSEIDFEIVKTDKLKRFEASRTQPEYCAQYQQSLLDKGIIYDINKETYNSIKQLTLQDLERFFNSEILKNPFAILIVGDKKEIDLSKLSEYGKVVIMNVDELFNY